MKIPKGTAEVVSGERERADEGAYVREQLSDAGGLRQFGAHLETLMPGAVSSDRHWHETEDELVLVLEGEAFLIEDDGEHVLRPGDAAAWPAGVPNAHQLVNRSDRPCRYLVVGARVAAGAIHYPDLGRTCHFEGGRWRVVDRDGRVIREGVEP